MDDCLAYGPSQAMYQDTSKSDVYASAKTVFGENVKRVRKHSGMSQESLALRIDADQAYISRIEAGQLNPTIETIAEIAKALDVEINELFRRN